MLVIMKAYFTIKPQFECHLFPEALLLLKLKLSMRQSQHVPSILYIITGVTYSLSHNCALYQS